MADQTGPNRIPTDSETRDDSDSMTSDSVDLASSFRMLSESVARIEAAEKEMAKAREASRIEAEKRRVESESRLTQMLLNTQLQIASLTRKRKRLHSNDDDSNNGERALLLSLLLHSNSMW